MNRAGARVVVVDNSGDLDPATMNGIAVVRPGRNLGYPAAINLGVAHLLSTAHHDFVLLANPDMTMRPAYVQSLKAAVSGERAAISFPDLPGGRTLGWQPRPTALGSAVAYAFRIHRAMYGVRTSRYPSGSLLLFNAKAIERLVDDDRLLAPDLFFMDDVEIADRAIERGVALRPVGGDEADVIHQSNGTGWRAPGVPYFFRRVAKIRYWSARRRRASAAILAAVIVVEAALVIAVTTVRRGSGLASVRPAAQLVIRSIGGYRRSFDDRVLAFGYHAPPAG